MRVGIIGLGRMGLSHLSIINTHPQVQVVGVCDAAGYVVDTLSRYTGLSSFSNHQELIRKTRPDAVLVATPSKSHGEIVRFALEHGAHVFVEKPFCLSLEEGRELVSLAERAGVVNQVGYHFRFVAAFQELKKLLEHGVIGKVHHFRMEAYGPVVLRPSGATWRATKSTGGGCLYDYASHAANLMEHLFGMPLGVGGTVIHSVFSERVDDEVYASVYYRDKVSGQLCVNWSDETHRKMSLRIEIWGTGGRINADRQECQIYLRNEDIPELYLRKGWNIRYATDLTAPVRYYLRGEEYTAQLDYFVDCVESGRRENVSSFASALRTDSILEMLERDAELGPRTRSMAAHRVPVGRGGLRAAVRDFFKRKLSLRER